MAKFEIDAMLKAAQWERAKGELRALVSMQGSYSSGGDDTHEYKRWQDLEKRVEAFVADVEDNGLHT